MPDSGGTVTTTVHITSINGLSGQPVGPLYLDGDSSRQLGGLVMSLINGDTKSGTWQQTISVAPNLMPGRYYLTIFPLTDSSQNTSNTFYKCPNGFVDYGTFAKPTPTPSLSTTASSTTTTDKTADYVKQISDLTSQNAELTSKIAELTAQVTALKNKSIAADKATALLNSLHAKILKICSVKKKPAGC